MMKQVLWVELYRPHTIADCILPPALKTTFQEIVNSGVILNMILSGKAGVGKTSVARAICDELDISYLIINSSERGNIDTIRTEVREFASTQSFTGDRKAIIFDEFDYANANSTQPALRSFIEEFAVNTSFIFTCNHPNRIIPELHSRAPVIEFHISKDDKADMQKQFLKRLRVILDTEQIPYEPQVLAQLILKHWPDMRRTINELQRYSKQGKIDAGIMEQIKDAPVGDLYKAIKDRDFRTMRTWCALHNDNDSVRVMRRIYDGMYDIFDRETIPDIVLLIGNYQYQAAFVSDHEVHLCAFLTELMQIAKFK
jgi:DNA polymerase III delta prime subunit